MDDMKGGREGGGSGQDINRTEIGKKTDGQLARKEKKDVREKTRLLLRTYWQF